MHFQTPWRSGWYKPVEIGALITVSRPCPYHYWFASNFPDRRSLLQMYCSCLKEFCPLYDFGRRGDSNCEIIEQISSPVVEFANWRPLQRSQEFDTVMFARTHSNSWMIIPSVRMHLEHRAISSAWVVVSKTIPICSRSMTHQIVGLKGKHKRSSRCETSK